MTSLRFVGDVPIWLGLLVAALAGFLAWRFYRRESLELSGHLRWCLPLLRTLAFCLGILILTGPVLHHRKVIGELGRVKIFVDGSASMKLSDRHLSVGRKLLIAEQQGWLEPGTTDVRLRVCANDLAGLRRQLSDLAENNPTDNKRLQELRNGLRNFSKRFSDTAGGSGQFAADFERLIQQPLATIADNPAQDSSALIAKVVSGATLFERQLLDAFEKSAQATVETSASASAAVAMFDESTRWQRTVQSLLDGPDSLLHQLEKNHDVEIFSLGDGQPWLTDESRSSDFGSANFPESHAGLVSDLASSLTANQATGSIRRTTSSNQSSADQSSADVPATSTHTAMVLLSDGQHNSGPSPLETAQLLGGQGIAIHTVSTGALQPAPDLAVTDIEYPKTVFLKDRIRGSIEIQDQMPPGQPFSLEITLDQNSTRSNSAASSTPSSVWKKQLVTNNAGRRRIEFEFNVADLTDEEQTTPDAVVQHALPLNFSAAIVPLKNESSRDNNRRAMRIAAITENYRVLIIDGRSRWETRYLRNVFQRDSQWDVNVIITGHTTATNGLPRGTDNGQFPETRDELFKYDIILFGEVPAELFSEHEFVWLREFVELAGGGFCFIDGQRGHLNQLTEQNLGPLLPVEWQAEAISTLPQKLQLTDRGKSEPAFSLATGPAANQSFWDNLPAPHTLNRVQALAGAEVLVEAIVNDVALPAVVTRQYGAGRVLYFAFDESWRWRYKVADTYHQRFWNQIAAFLIPRPFAASDEFVAIDTGPVSYDSGAEPDFRVRLTGQDGKPMSDATVDALVWKDGKVVSTVSLMSDKTIPGIYRGKSAALTEGQYEVSVQASGFSHTALRARGEFVVLPPETGELATTVCNAELLQQMALDSGGTFLKEEQVGQLVEILQPLSSGHVEESDTELWQSYWWFGAMILLLATEWFFRKRAGLL